MSDLAPAPGAWLAPAGRSPLVIGVDPSLTCTGIAGDGWADALRPKGRGHERLQWLRQEVRERTRAADLVVIEGAAYGNGGQAGHHELAGLWWILTQDLWERDIPYVVVAPSSRIVYAMGVSNPAQDHPKEKRARIAKGMVRDAVAERYGLDWRGPGQVRPGRRVHPRRDGPALGGMAARAGAGHAQSGPGRGAVARAGAGARAEPAAR